MATILNKTIYRHTRTITCNILPTRYKCLPSHGAIFLAQVGECWLWTRTSWCFHLPCSGNHKMSQLIHAGAYQLGNLHNFGISVLCAVFQWISIEIYLSAIETKKMHALQQDKDCKLNVLVDVIDSVLGAQYIVLKCRILHICLLIVESTKSVIFTFACLYLYVHNICLLLHFWFNTNPERRSICTSKFILTRVRTHDFGIMIGYPDALDYTSNSYWQGSCLLHHAVRMWHM